jgi:hypothetical protein
VMRVADSLELVRIADLVLLVARSGVSHWRHVQAVPDRIRKVGGVVSGVVLNDVPARASQFTYGYHSTVSGSGSQPPAESGTEQSRPEVDDRRGSAVPAASARKSTVRANTAKRPQKKAWSGQPKKSPDKRPRPGKSSGGSR